MRTGTEVFMHDSLGSQHCQRWWCVKYISACILRRCCQRFEKLENAVSIVRVLGVGRYLAGRIRKDDLPIIIARRAYHFSMRGEICDVIRELYLIWVSFHCLVGNNGRTA